MFYHPLSLSNASSFPGNPQLTIEIFITDENWVQAWQNYCSGKNPTDSPEWKKGVVLHFAEVYGPHPEHISSNS